MIQRLYAAYVLAGAGVATAFAGLALGEALSQLSVSSGRVILAVFGSFAVFVPLGVLFRRSYRRGIPLALPAWLPRRVAELAPAFLLAAVAMLIAYGVYRWPYGVRATPTGYVDKRGHPATETDYVALQRWEVVYFATWGACCVLGAVTMPLAKSRRDVS